MLSDIKVVTIVTHDFRKALQTYLATTLGIAAPALSAWPGVKMLPRYLADGFAFHELDLLGQACLLMVAKQEAPTPVELQRQLRAGTSLSAPLR